MTDTITLNDGIKIPAMTNLLDGFETVTFYKYI